MLLLDEEACRSRHFHPSRVGWILSSLNQNQAVACAQKSKEKETSHLRWSDKNGEQKIVLHPAYLAAVYSEEDSPRAVFHHAGVWQPGPPSSYSLRTSGIGRRHICWRPSISHRVCTHHFQGRMRSWENPSCSNFSSSAWQEVLENTWSGSSVDSILAFFHHRLTNIPDCDSFLNKVQEMLPFLADVHRHQVDISNY